MGWVVWVLFAPLAIGLVDWAAGFVVAAVRGSATWGRSIDRLLRCYLILAVAFFIAGVLAAPTAAAVGTLPHIDRRQLNDAFFWTQPAGDAAVDVLLLALDAVGMAVCAGGFALTWLLVRRFRELGPQGETRYYRKPGAVSAEYHHRPRSVVLWGRWVLRFAICVGIHWVATPDGLLVSALVTGLAAVSFGLVAQLEWYVWRGKERRLAGDSPRPLALTGQRRLVVAIGAGLLTAVSLLWPLYALLYEGRITSASDTTSKAGMMFLAALFNAVGFLADLAKERTDATQ